MLFIELCIWQDKLTQLPKNRSIFQTIKSLSVSENKRYIIVGKMIIFNN